MKNVPLRISSPARWAYKLSLLKQQRCLPHRFIFLSFLAVRLGWMYEERPTPYIQPARLVWLTNYRYLNNNGVCHTDLFF